MSQALLHSKQWNIILEETITAPLESCASSKAVSTKLSNVAL